VGENAQAVKFYFTNKSMLNFTHYFKLRVCPTFIPYASFLTFLGSRHPLQVKKFEGTLTTKK